MSGRQARRLWSEDVGWSGATTASEHPPCCASASGLGPLVVLGASFVGRHGPYGPAGFDLACGATSVLTITAGLVAIVVLRR